jgi:hypothetical protein
MIGRWFSQSPDAEHAGQHRQGEFAASGLWSASVNRSSGGAGGRSPSCTPSSIRSPTLRLRPVRQHFAYQALRVIVAALHGGADVPSVSPQSLDVGLRGRSRRRLPSGPKQDRAGVTHLDRRQRRRRWRRCRRVHERPLSRCRGRSSALSALGQLPATRTS